MTPNTQIAEGYLRQAKEAERRAMEIMDQSQQDALLDSTVALRVLASLPSYRPLVNQPQR